MSGISERTYVSSSTLCLRERHNNYPLLCSFLGFVYFCIFCYRFRTKKIFGPICLTLFQCFITRSRNVWLYLSRVFVSQFVVQSLYISLESVFRFHISTHVRTVCKTCHHCSTPPRPTTKYHLSCTKSDPNNIIGDSEQPTDILTQQYFLSSERKRQGHYHRRDLRHLRKDSVMEQKVPNQNKHL